MHITNISEAKSSLSALIALVEQGKEIIIGRAGKPIARLVPYQPDQTDRKLGGSWEGKVRIADGFDELPADIMHLFQGYGA
ncbi:MAG: type II toxin-antitoxin system Phd/YefM family antitoxin [Candidatus Thiothrix moscowensis]|nr:type II toxin-antitoxin system Phd/YefM family antitoxin [Candidatus Thiothrix moscowensis]